jgi:hypothetical protein
MATPTQDSVLDLDCAKITCANAEEGVSRCFLRRLGDGQAASLVAVCC